MRILPPNSGGTTPITADFAQTPVRTLRICPELHAWSKAIGLEATYARKPGRMLTYTFVARKPGGRAT